MKQADAGAGRGDDIGVPAPSRWRETTCATCPILSGRAVEMAAKGAREHLMAGETDAGGDRHDGLGVRQQPGGRPFEPEPQSVLLRRFARDRAERAMEMKRRPSRARGQVLQRHVIVETAADVSKQLQDFACTWHWQAE
ncbi:MAG: hypothetical protein ABI868_04020 [Acidobacteriota bacterium]